MNLKFVINELKEFISLFQDDIDGDWKIPEMPLFIKYVPSNTVINFEFVGYVFANIQFSDKHLESEFIKFIDNYEFQKKDCFRIHRIDSSAVLTFLRVKKIEALGIY